MVLRVSWSWLAKIALRIVKSCFMGLVSVVEAVEEGGSVWEWDFDVAESAAAVHSSAFVCVFLFRVALDGVSVVVGVFVGVTVWVVCCPPVGDCLGLFWCEVFSF